MFLVVMVQVIALAKRLEIAGGVVAGIMIGMGAAAFVIMPIIGLWHPDLTLLRSLAYVLAYAIGGIMSLERHVRLFKNGRNQAVRIPREFELPGQDAIMRKEGDSLVIEPAPPRSLLAVLASLDPIEEQFPPIEELPIEPVD